MESKVYIGNKDFFGIFGETRFKEVGIPVVNMGIPVAETFRQKKVGIPVAELFYRLEYKINDKFFYRLLSGITTKAQKVGLHDVVTTRQQF